jgi:CDGSH-type Zn-finger protein/uncharacterized Fe-S cluster protein YjdI
MDERVRYYSSEDIDVTFSPQRCIHAAECLRGLPDVFDNGRRPWVQPANAAADRIAGVVRRCPSGALHYRRKNGGPEEAADARNTVVPTPDGPYYVRGQVTITAPDGGEMRTETRAALCRCGRSENKPFCDNSHWSVSFGDPGRVEGNENEMLAHHGPLEVLPSRNGPYRLKGDFEIVSADGRSVFRGTRTSLCRCGGSGSKPFCDGTHRRIGFTTDE